MKQLKPLKIQNLKIAEQGFSGIELSKMESMALRGGYDGDNPCQHYICGDEDCNLNHCAYTDPSCVIYQ